MRAEHCRLADKEIPYMTRDITAQDLYNGLRAAAADLDAYGSTMGTDGIVALDGRFDLTAMAAYLNGTAEVDAESNMQTP